MCSILFFVCRLIESIFSVEFDKICLEMNTEPNCWFEYHLICRFPPNYFEQTYEFDFFNYAGIQRPVKLYTTPLVYVDDIITTTNVSGTTGMSRFVQ